MLKQTLAAIAAICVSIVQAQTVNVRGKIVDATNKGVANAKVELLKAKQSSTTGADGSYSITSTSALRTQSSPMSGGIRLENSALEMTVARSSTIRVELFDLKGNHLKTLAHENAASGIYRLELAGRITGEKMVVIKASNGEETRAFPYLPMSSTESMQPVSDAFSLSSTGPLAKVSAVLDTLQVTASGFPVKQVPITSLDTMVNVTLSAAGEDIWGGLKNPPAMSAGCGKAAGITNGKKTITSSGQSRSYIIDIPSGYDMNKPYKFFYCSHWISSSAEAVVDQKYYWMKEQATTAGEQAIFLAPQALPGNPNGTWATGPYIGTNAHDSIDNVLFVDILKYVKQNLCIDTTRVFATGFSFGGMMTYSLSANRQTLIRAAVGIAPANYNIYVPPKTHLPIAWMQTTGMSDGTCPWICSGGQCNASKDGAKWIAMEHAKDNGCTIPTDIPTTNSGPHTCYDFTGCKTGYPVKACTFNGPHTNVQSDPGSNVNWIPQESWKFFSQF